tara:strand:+ start:672 stop:2525 length:1854 start_codon:yes stop_codon:yes gene_type:complete
MAKVIEIDLKVTQSKISINKLRQDVEKLDGRTLKYREAVQKLRLEEQKLAANRNKLIKSNQSVVKSQMGLVKSTKDMQNVSGSANQAAQELGRTVSDLPFGIMGVGNNISQLGSIFGTLVQKTGGVTGALKSIKTALTGPLGILIGFQAVVAFIQTDFFSSMLKGGEAASEMAKSQKEVNKALDEFAGKEVIIKSYLKTLEDVNASERDRALATQELIKLVPDLKKEDFEYGETIDDVRKKINDYILSQAARIEIDKLVALNSETLAKQSRINRLREIEDLDERSKAIRSFLKEQGERTTVTFASGVAVGLGVSTKEREQTKEELDVAFQEYSKTISEKSEPVLSQIEELKKSLSITPKSTKDTADELEKEFQEWLTATEKRQSEEEKIRDEEEKIRVEGQQASQDLALEEEQFEIDQEERRLARLFAFSKKANEQKKKDSDEDIKKKKELAKKELDIDKKLTKAKSENAKTTAGVLDSLSDTAGKNTAIGKGLAVASATINTYRGVSDALAAVTVTPFDTALKFSNAAAIGVAGFQNVSAINSVTIPDQASTVAGTTAPTPTVSAPSFNLIEGTEGSNVADSVNTQNNTPLKAYVVSSEVTSGQELDRKIESVSTT